MQTEIKNSSSGGITIAIIVLIVAIVAFFILSFTNKDKKPSADKFTGDDDKKDDEGTKQIKASAPVRQQRMMRIPLANGGVKSKPFGAWHPEELQSIGVSITILNRVLQVREELKASNTSPDNLIKYLNNPAGPGMDPFSTMKQVQMAYNAMYGNEKQGPYSLISALKGVHDQFGRLRPTITHLTEFTNGVSKEA